MAQLLSDEPVKEWGIPAHKMEVGYTCIYSILNAVDICCDRQLDQVHLHYE